MISHRPIGIFDSGIGGLTVLKELSHALPQEDFIYFGDTANLPYGEKTPEQIIDYTRQTITWMQNEMGAKLIIAACHTSSAIALDHVLPEFKIPLIGTIYPMVEEILQKYPQSRIGIIATPASVKSRVHERILMSAGFKGHLHSISCPQFVPLIEAGHTNSPELWEASHDYLKEFQEKNLDTLIYGCTHYPWIETLLRQILPSTIHHLNPAAHIVTKTSQELYRHKMVNSSQAKGTISFFSSSAPETFSQQIRSLMTISHPQVALKTFPTSDYTFHQKNVVNQ